MLSTVLRQFYNGRWETSPVPTETISDYDGINWVGEPPPKSEVQAKMAELREAEPIRLLRVDRNKLLASSDWTGLSDTALTNEQAAKWKLYRQKLRDLPGDLDTEFKVKNVKWPKIPE